MCLCVFVAPWQPPGEHFLEWRRKRRELPIGSIRRLIIAFIDHCRLPSVPVAHQVIAVITQLPSASLFDYFNQ